MAGDYAPCSLFVLVGPPAAGKSTWAAGRGLEVVTLDGFRQVAVDGRSSDRSLVLSARRKVSTLLADRRSVIVDGCNLQPATRSMWRNIAAEHGARAVAVVFTTEPDLCVKRDQARGDLAVAPGRMAGFLSAAAGVFDAVRSEPWDSVEVVGEAASSRRW